MNYINKWDAILEQFKRSFPTIAEKTTDWYPSGQFEITAVLCDGRKIIYSGLTDTIRNAIVHSSGDLYSEQEWRNNFARRFMRKMHESCVNQKSISEITGISEQTLSKYLNGRSSPSTYNIAKIANTLGCSISELVEFEDLSID